MPSNPHGIHCPDCTVIRPCRRCAAQIDAEALFSPVAAVMRAGRLGQITGPERLVRLAQIHQLYAAPGSRTRWGSVPEEAS
jgi:hypothetical protein